MSCLNKVSELCLNSLRLEWCFFSHLSLPKTEFDDVTATAHAISAVRLCGREVAPESVHGDCVGVKFGIIDSLDIV
jgi:hypothetical protein